MRIRGVRTVPFESPLRRPLGDVQLPDGARRYAEMAVFLDTDEEPVGIAVATPAAEGTIHALAADLVGEDPLAVIALHERMQRRLFKGGTGGAGGNALATLDCALWDLRAKIHGVPLWRELGGSDRRVPAYASGLDMGLSDDQLRTYYRDMAANHGLRAGKLKIGRHPVSDARRLAIMRDALAEGSGRTDVSLMVDANEFWTPKQAVRRIAELEQDFDLVWVEEPVRRDDHPGLARVSQGIRSSVATGENLTAPSQFVPLLRHESVDVVQVAIQGTGITGALRIFEMADAFGLPVALVNSPGRYAAHVGAVLSNHLAMEILDAGPDTVYTIDDQVEDGMIVLGDSPGLGITFEPERLARYAVTEVSADAMGRRYRRAADSGVSEPGIAGGSADRPTA
ncbi:MAG: mandelate racemase/muconate lactonizing enzyme family protein [Chloroflexota bacterium]